MVTTAMLLVASDENVAPQHVPGAVFAAVKNDEGLFSKG